MARRGYGEDSIYFDHEGNPCSDAVRHRNCGGRWRGEIQTGRADNGRRLVRKASGKSKTAVADKLKTIRDEIEQGITKPAPANYTVRKAAEDWLAGGLDGRAPLTIGKNRRILEPVLTMIGSIRLRELTAQDVDRALRVMAKTYASSTVAMSHGALARVIRYAARRDQVARNVATFTDSPKGKAGRASRAMSLEQVGRLLKAAEASPRMRAYISLSIGTSIRTEEARALRWENVYLDATPPFAEIWHSVRLGGDTKTDGSRRTLALPSLAADALRALRPEGASGLVFSVRRGKGKGRALDAANVRREFRVVCEAAGIGTDWTPRELRHTGVSLLSLGGLPIEEIARVAGHSSTRTTELVYRKELRPVLTRGAEAVDRLLDQAASPPARNSSS